VDTTSIQYLNRYHINPLLSFLKLFIIFLQEKSSGPDMNDIKGLKTGLFRNLSQEISVKKSQSRIEKGRKEE